MAGASVSSENSSPLSEMNTTPLIDVMLVLLIMFILTVPIQMHATKVALPASVPGVTAPEQPLHRIDIDALGSIYWDGAAVSEAILAQHLISAAGADAEIRLKPDAYARYEVVNRVVATVQRSGIERIGFIGNEAFAN